MADLIKASVFSHDRQAERGIALKQANVANFEHHLDGQIAYCDLNDGWKAPKSLSALTAPTESRSSGLAAATTASQYKSAIAVE